LHGRSEVIFSLHGNEPELEYLSFVTFLELGVDKVEHAVVGPDALSQLLIYPNPFRESLTLI
jgi:hypothetical protein